MKVKASPKSTKTGLRGFFDHWAIDRAVFYALLLRGWQLIGGSVSLLLIGHFFSRETQGYYYTFASLMALQSFFELGMHAVIIATASHQWSKLRIGASGTIEGDPDSLSRLISLSRVITIWYTCASLLFVTTVGIVGVVFFSMENEEAIAWLAPWLSLVLASGLLLWLLPYNAVLEGCNQVATVNRFRVIQAVFANVAVWCAILLGFGLWAAVASIFARVACEIYLIGFHYRNFIKGLLRRPAGPTIGWRTDLWPMQWRLAIGVIFFYFEYAIYTPVMFHYHGSVVAGQMGMTWTLLSTLQAAAISWVQARAPRFGMLIADRQFRELDRLFFRVSAICISVTAMGGFAIFVVIWLLNLFAERFAGRLLSLPATTVFLVAVVLAQIPRCQDIYLRAHRREPLMLVNVISSTLIGLLIWQLGLRFGPTGAATAYLIGIAFFNLPVRTFIWRRCRHRWHQDTTPKQ